MANGVVAPRGGQLALAMLAFIAVAGEGHMGHDYYQLPLVPICALYFAAVAWPAFDAGWIARTVGPGVLSRVVTGAAIGGVGLVCFLQSGVIERHFRPANLDERLWLAAQAIDGPADNSGLMVVVDDYGVNSPMLLYSRTLGAGASTRTRQRCTSSRGCGCRRARDIRHDPVGGGAAQAAGTCHVPGVAP